MQTPIPTELQTLFRLNPTELASTANNKKAEEAVGKIAEQVPVMQKIEESDQANVEKKVTDSAKEVAETFKNSLAAVIAKCLKYLDKSILVSGYNI